MARTLSTRKRVRQNLKRRLRNRIAKATIKTEVKKTLVSISTKNVDTAKSQLKTVYKLLDKAVERGILHKNNAARRKSRLAQKIAALSAK
ncbi:MAG: 30S ribosomal protein S20 [Planctomycetes bacterium RBG_16_43_13]|nr:MAG: 30S ribosomal protein S20 [Planctomycetes bacterium RBG_16_43_13]